MEYRVDDPVREREAEAVRDWRRVEGGQQTVVRAALIEVRRGAGLLWKKLSD
jgi:hypothetical protein